DRCVELGVGIIDTAHSYAAGASQQMIGHWLAADPVRRGQVAIVDKVGIVDRAGDLVLDLSPDSVLAQAAQGRRRLGVETVDVVMAHGKDPVTAPRDTLRAFADLLECGQASCWGVSNVSHGDLTVWLEGADRIGMPDPFFVENQYSLLARGDEADVLPLCRERGIAYLAFSPLAGGVLSGKYRPGQPPPPGSRQALRPEFAGGLNDQTHTAIAILGDRAGAAGVSAAALALAWVLAQPGIRPIVGVSRPAHLDALEAAIKLDLSPAKAAALFEGLGLSE
ncbi:MAG TPA: aldo/keto reductase, partial [Egibacteraceae bacterium]|nr:aldo/keto reductase [Egibacteraceae bacterium]